MKPIILDADPGIDDAIAFMLLLPKYDADVKLIVSGYGNVSSDQATQNALAMKAILKSKVPVVQGALSSTSEHYVAAPHIHGVDGLGGLSSSLPKAEPLATDDYLQVVYDTICAAGEVVYITLGPLTNLAALLIRFPDVKEKISRVVTMGGGISMGNVTEFAEFNIHCDAQSAAYVFEHVKEIALVSLNMTSLVAFTQEAIAEIGKTNSEITRIATHLLNENYQNCIRYGEHGSTMNDSAAVLFALHPEFFTVTKCAISVTCSGERYGETKMASGDKNVLFARTAHPDKLLAKIEGEIKRLAKLV